MNLFNDPLFLYPFPLHSFDNFEKNKAFVFMGGTHPHIGFILLHVIFTMHIGEKNKREHRQSKPFLKILHHPVLPRGLPPDKK